MAARKRVLVVDDDVNARTIHSTWLHHAGYDVVEAPSATAAVELARSHKPHLVLVDLLMPTMDGWDLLERLRHDPVTRDAILVALTVLSPDEDRRNPIRRGFDQYWVKPLPAADLLLRTRQLIGDAGGTDGTGRTEGPGRTGRTG